MRDTLILLHTNLAMFDGEGGAGDGAGGSDAGGMTANGEAPVGANGEGLADLPSDGEPNGEKAPSPEDREKMFKDLINKEYKDLYTKETQKIIDRRFKETKKLEKQLSGQSEILDMLMGKYNASDLDSLRNAIENDDSMWEEAAYEANMSVDQYKKMRKLERQNAELINQQRAFEENQKVEQQLADWYAQADEVKKAFPNFDFEMELQDTNFANLLRAGVPIDHAYKVCHMNEIVTNATNTASANAEKRVTENIRARGNRPVENGASSTSAFTTKTDVNKMTKEEREEIARRVAKGEFISFNN